MITFERTEEYLKKTPDVYLPDIRYFEGVESFCNVMGNYKAKTLEESINLFLDEQHSI